MIMIDFNMSMALPEAILTVDPNNLLQKTCTELVF